MWWRGVVGVSGGAAREGGVGTGESSAAGESGGAAGDGGGGVGVDRHGLLEVGGHQLGDQGDAGGSADQEDGVELVGIELGGV
jgi:hypothetical protein